MKVPRIKSMGRDEEDREDAHLLCSYNACHFHHTWLVLLRGSISNSPYHIKMQFALVEAHKTMRNMSISNIVWDI